MPKSYDPDRPLPPPLPAGIEAARTAHAAPTPRDGGRADGPAESSAPTAIHHPGPQPRRIVRSAETVRPRSVRCRQCGGDVGVRDSADTVMVVCTSCGTALDVSSPGDAQILFKTSPKARPACPVKIGDACRLTGKKYVAIGRIHWEERDEDGVWTWDEIQLFHPEAGYVYLLLENGHWATFRPLRKKIAVNPRHLVPKKTLYVSDDRYTVFECSSATIGFVEGELSWVARIGDRAGYMDAIHPPFMVSAEWTEKELEWTIGRYHDREFMARALGKKPSSLPAPQGVAPAQPFLRSASRGTMVKLGLWAAAALLVVLLVHNIVGSRREIYRESFQARDYLSESGAIGEPFEVPAGKHVGRLDYSASLDNSWVALGIAFLDEEDNVLLGAEGDIEYYHGREGGESWSEGSRKGRTLLRLEGPRTYRLNVFGTAGSGQSGPPGNESLTVSLTSGVVPLRYYLVALLLVLGLPVMEIGRRVLFESRRWPSEDD